MFSTGIAVAIPDGYVGFIKPRSGLAYKHGIDVLGGVIDSGYRGEIGVILLNTDAEAFPINVGGRIAQLVIQPVALVNWAEVEDLPESERSGAGFGSTGVR
jgi:dUTP pyrophosphatase